ncbi:hypothetical protein ABS71_15895 [bacterium SCN 62-11]|nr:MAG: hypothetical protein ABS71_15895 [bacterium SCN 62-11]
MTLQWEDKVNHEGVPFQQRPVPAEDGGKDWREILFKGHQPFQLRTVAASDGGPAWTERRFPGQAKEAYIERRVPSQDGGPDWTEKKIGDKPVQKTRTVACPDGGPAWKETVGSSGVSSKSRTVPASDGGNAWRETESKGKLTRQRSVADSGGKGAWSEIHSSTGHHLTRQYTEDGVKWKETINGQNRHRSPAEGVAGMAAAAALKGTDVLSIDGLEIKIHGGASPTQLALLRTALEAMPPGARIYATDISLCENLGETLTPEGEHDAGVGGLAGSTQIVLNSQRLETRAAVQRLLFHEAGHIADNQLGSISQKPPWGGDTSVSRYGSTNSKEDFAETHRVVLADFPRYSSMSASDWAEESECEKKMHIAALYGAQVPSLEQVRQAETPETLEKRTAMEAANAFTEGNEIGRIFPSRDGGPPWREMLADGESTGRTRFVTAKDGGPQWKEFEPLEGRAYKRRELTSDDGGKPWTEWHFAGGQPYKTRMVEASDDGPAWQETQPSGSPAYKERKVLAEDGGPVWTERLNQGSDPYKKREVPAGDAGKPWTEWQYVGHKPFKTRMVDAEDGGSPWKERLNDGAKPFKERTVEAGDGGSAWTERWTEGAKPYKKREVQAEDGGGAWTQWHFAGYKPYNTRMVKAEDGGPSWKEIQSPAGHKFTREVRENGVRWEEVRQDGQLKRTRMPDA